MKIKKRITKKELIAFALETFRRNGIEQERGIGCLTKGNHQFHMYCMKCGVGK